MEITQDLKQLPVLRIFCVLQNYLENIQCICDKNFIKHFFNNFSVQYPKSIILFKCLADNTDTFYQG